MTLLHDGAILYRLQGTGMEDWQRLRIDPVNDKDIQPCSVDVHLGRSLKIYEGSQMDTRRDNADWWRAKPLIGDTHDDDPAFWSLHPGRLYLGKLEEFILIPEDVCGQIIGISTMARCGVTPHQQAGLLDPGWFGNATLEITVDLPGTILIPGMRIAQVVFQLLDQRCLRPYRGRYQGDTEAQPARLIPSVSDT